MKFSLLAGAVTAAALSALAGVAHAVSIPVANASFETLPSGGLPFGCGTGCSYSVGPIPDWTDISGNNSGQFQPGSSSGNFTYFNYVPDGVTVAYSNGGGISQVVGQTAQAGVTYTLSVDVGVRPDYFTPPVEQLIVNGNAVNATGVFASPGNWSTFTASYTATAADAGKPIEILLFDQNPQGNWDNVRLTAGAVPEPATWTLMILGAGGLGAALRGRRRTGAATA